MELTRNTLYDDHQDLFVKIITDMEDWIMISDELGKIVYANNNVYSSCDIKEEAVIGQDMCMFVGVDLTDDLTIEQIGQLVRGGGRFEFITSRCIKDNKKVYLTNTLSSMRSDIGKDYYVCLSKDITSTKKLKEELYHTNYFDKLTNLPNEKVFLKNLIKEVKRVESHHSQFALVLIDIKRLGEINNIYGFTSGDVIIKEVANRIQVILREGQEIFKYSGDTFALIVDNAKGEVEVHKLLKKIKKTIEEPIQIGGRMIYADFRAGITFCPEDANKPYELIKHAKIALGKAKEYKKNGYTLFYTDNIREEAESSMKIEEDMQLAVKNDEFLVYYQPFVALETEKIVGMEALIRRRTCNGEIMFPGSFISVLEKMHLIEKVGIDVLEKVCRQLREWLDLGYKIVPVSVNLSALQFKNPSLAEDIKSVVRRYNILSDYIVLEITESTVMEDVEIADRTINELKEYGFSIAIDDFGTGYASIGYLKKFMFDHLKIDISFVREIVQNKEDRSIVAAIIAIAKTLNLKTIAEGIESEEQLYVMSSLGCEMGQGFFWDKPITPEEIESKYLKNCL